MRSTNLRKRHDLPVRQPLASVTVVTRSTREREAVTSHAELIAEELNVAAVEVHDDEAGLVDLGAKANFKVLGPRLGRDMKTVAAIITNFDHDTIVTLLDGGTVSVNGFTFTEADIVVSRSPRSGSVVAAEGSISVALDSTMTDSLRTEGVARELVNRIQSMRRQLRGPGRLDRVQRRCPGRGARPRRWNSQTERKTTDGGRLTLSAIRYPLSGIRQPPTANRHPVPASAESGKGAKRPPGKRRGSEATARKAKPKAKRVRASSPGATTPGSAPMATGQAPLHRIVRVASQPLSAAESVR